MRELLLVGWPSANAHIHSVWCWNHEGKSKDFLGALDLFHHQHREAQKEPPRQSTKFKPDSRGAINISNTSNHHCFRMSSLQSLGVRHCIWIDMSDANDTCVDWNYLACTSDHSNDQNHLTSTLQVYTWWKHFHKASQFQTAIFGELSKSSNLDCRSIYSIGRMKNIVLCRASKQGSSTSLCHMLFGDNSKVNTPIDDFRGINPRREKGDIMWWS